MSIDILNMRSFKENAQAIDVALPVLAVECEAAPPLENYLDAYEEAVLKFVELGLSTHGISKTMNAAESLIEEVLAQLEQKKYAYRESGNPWKLTADGKKYLNGEVEERASDESQYGYMFVNAIKKEVLPFFYQGNVGQISLFRGKTLPFKLTLGGDEEQTFLPSEIKQTKLKKAYKAYFRNRKTIGSFNKDEILREEAEDRFAGSESFDEEDQEVGIGGPMTGELTGNMFIRALNKEPTKLYLRMRIVINPQVPGGYRVESPFDFNGLDDQFFLRQIQWLEQSESAYIADKVLSDFLRKEIYKISSLSKIAGEDFSVFLLTHMRLLKRSRSKVSYVYEDLERIYPLMQRQSNLLEKGNVVSNLARLVVEGLFNVYFRSISLSKLKQIKQKAFDDMNACGDVNYKKTICKAAGLNEDILQWVSKKHLKTILVRLEYTYGNSIMEKFINMLVIEYYLGDVQIRGFFNSGDITEIYNLIDKLNRIRNMVSHDTDKKFTGRDYDFYMDHVFVLANHLLEGLNEG